MLENQVEHVFTCNSLSMSFSFSARKNQIVPPARHIKLSVMVVIHSNAIPKCVFVNNNDTKILKENNHIVRLVEQPSSIYFRRLDKTPSRRLAIVLPCLLKSYQL